MNTYLDAKKLNYLLELRRNILKDESFQLIYELNIEKENVYILKNKIKNLESENQHKINYYNHVISSIYNSSSWKITSPIRCIKNLLDSAKNKLRNIKSEPAPKILNLEQPVLNYDYWINNIENTENTIFSQCKQNSFLINIFINTNNIEDLCPTLASINNLNYKFCTLKLYNLTNLNSSDLNNLIQQYTNIQNFSILAFESDFENQIIKQFNSLSDDAWVLFLFPGDCIAANIFTEVNQSIGYNKNIQLIYSDEDELNITNLESKRINPNFKPDFNLFLFYSLQYINHSFIIKADLLKNIKSFSLNNFTTQFFQLLLNYIDKIDHKNIHHIAKILFHLNSTSNKINYLNARPFLQDFLNTKFYKCEVSLIDNNFGLKITYDFNDTNPPPLVSIIIPTRNGLHLLSRCVTSIIQKTNYTNYEIIIIDNGSNDINTINYLNNIKCDFIKIIRDDSPFNYSTINNNAVNIANGEYICLMNNDIEVITPNWLTEMMSYARQKNIGCVGAKLLYPNNKVQHGGVILGIGGLAGHCHFNLHQNDAGYFNRAQVVQELSAVTAACLLVKKSIYLEVGGLDSNLAVAFNDVNFCLDVLKLGYKNIWTPFALLYHFESASRGFEDTPEKMLRFNQELDFIKQKWGDALYNDFAYNPNLCLQTTVSTFSIAFKNRN